MRTSKTPALLVVVIRTSAKQWFVAGSTECDPLLPLVCSEPGNLGEYVDLPPDDQLSFMRHRIAGAIQRGFDRLYAKDAKTQQIILFIDDEFPNASPNLLQRVGDHFAAWMTRPAVCCYRGTGVKRSTSVEQLTRISGLMERLWTEQFEKSLPHLTDALDVEEIWEHVPTPATGA